MSFQPVVVGTGLAGWQFLQATQDRQREVFNKSPLLQRDTEYFRENIRGIQSAEQLVSDRRLLRVALGAFGLQDDISNKFFIQKVLEGNPADSESLAGRLSDERYKKLSEAFGFYVPVANTVRENFASDIIDRFNTQEFERAVGQQNDSLRLAMNFRREIAEVTGGDSSENAKWFRIMGNPPMRNVLETALGLPGSFGQLDIDQQREVFEDKARSRFGIDTASDLAAPDVVEKVVQSYLLQSEIRNNVSTNSTSIALTLLRGF